MSGSIENLSDFIAKKAERVRYAYDEAKRVKQIMDEAKRRQYENTVHNLQEVK
jgi:hypothetical protein